MSWQGSGALRLAGTLQRLYKTCLRLRLGIFVARFAQRHATYGPWQFAVGEDGDKVCGTYESCMAPVETVIGMHTYVYAAAALLRMLHMYIL